MEGKAPSTTRPILGVHPNVFLLGLVSMFTDVSTEMVFTTLPLFLANVLGVKTTIIGLIEGVAETTANVLRIPSGWLSDRWRRKPLTVIGYGLSTVVTPLMHITSSWGLVLGVRVTDRMGKGIRVPARDALLADSAAAEARGRSFGFHRALDTSGSVIGLALAAMVVFLTQRGTLVLTRSTYQWFVVAGTCFAVLAVALLVLRVRERPRLRT